MGKSLFITEKPSVAREFASALGVKSSGKDGYIEDSKYVITWCIGHLISMSYPEKYDEALKQWKIETLPFLPDPDKYKYEVIKDVKQQYSVVKQLLNRKDIDCIYYAGDSAREGEYIQRLVRQMAGRNKSADEKRVWIDSQTKEEILNGIKNAKPLSYYDHLSDSAYARAIEDYGIGINFSRAMSLKYSNNLFAMAGEKRGAIAVGRVMSCVLGMIVERERAIRNDVKTIYYTIDGMINDSVIPSFVAKKKSQFYSENDLYKDFGFLQKDKAEWFTQQIEQKLLLDLSETSTEKKYAPLLFNLAELQSECSRLYKINSKEALDCAQRLYDAKLTTYPRTDARVLTTAVCKEITNNIDGIVNSGNNIPSDIKNFAKTVQNKKGYDKDIVSTKYVDDSKVKDHYAIIPTGYISGIDKLSDLDQKVYFLIVRRFLSIFFPPAEFEKLSAIFLTSDEVFKLSCSAIRIPGWMEVADKIPDTHEQDETIKAVKKMQIGNKYDCVFEIKEKETAPPKRYTSGSIILAMENAGQLIEEEELREQIKGSGIGTSATRAETIDKLVRNKYIAINKKTQVIQPTKLGELIYDILSLTIPVVLSPKMTASWEKGLSQIEDGSVDKNVYLTKMYDYIKKNTSIIIDSDALLEFNKKARELDEVYGKSKTQDGAGETIVCPVCKKGMLRHYNTEKGSGYFCSESKRDGSGTCNFIISSKWAKKQIPESQMLRLLSGQPTIKMKGFIKQNGEPFKYPTALILENGRIQIYKE